MSPVAAAILTFLATTTLVGTLGVLAGRACFNYREQTNRRMDELTTKDAAGSASALFKGLSRQGAASGSWSTWLDEYIDQAGMSRSAASLLGIGCGTAATLAVGVALATSRWWLAALAGLSGLMTVPAYIYLTRKRRMNRLFLQLPQALQLITRAVRAGQTVPAAFRLVAEELEPPISYDFRICYERQNLGMSFDTSLRALARRTGIVELQILAVVLLVQSRTGGNLVELLGELTKTVYKRLKFKQRLRSLTSEGRLQALVLILLPTAAFIGLHFVSPEYVATLHQHPKLLAVTVFAQLLGALWIRQCLHCNY